MKIATLPKQLDLRGLAARGASVSGTVAPGELPRLDEAGVLPWLNRLMASFSLCRDENSRSVVAAEVKATLTMQCQRCLGEMSVPLNTSSTMACVWTDDEAASLPAFYEPLLVSDEAVLRDIVEEEILLAFASFPAHETECKTREQFAALEPLNASSDEVTEVRAQSRQPVWCVGAVEELTTGVERTKQE